MEKPTPSPLLRRLLGPQVRALALGLLVAGLAALVGFFPLGQALENQVLDLCYRLNPIQAAPANLLIVAIDEASFQEVKSPWPWPRRYHAELVRRLAAGGARLIAFDVLFAEPGKSDNGQSDDKLFAQAMKEAGNVILGETFEVVNDPHFFRVILVTPVKPLQEGAKQVGLIKITPDPDGVVRRFRLRGAGRNTLAGVVAGAIKPEAVPPPGFTGLINYVGPARSIDTVSYYQVIDKERPLPAARIRDRIVLVGRSIEASATPQGQADTFYTPFFAGGGQLMAGVEIHANIVHSLLSGSWRQELNPTRRLILLFTVLLLASLILVRLRPLGGLVLTLALMALVGGLSFALFYVWSFWLPPVLLAGGLALVYTGHVLGHYFVEAREKRWLRHAFGRYVSPGVVDALSAHPERLELGGEEVEATVLFADIEGFTRISEGMSPQDLVRLLNDYFSPMTQIILAHRGTLDKYIGDAIMALWGAPLALPDHALRACRAALEMQESMAGLQADWAARDLPRLNARIGLHTGNVVAGNVGSRDRFNYTVLGDTVNLASRLEGVNKVYGTHILMSAETCRLVKDTLLVRELDLVKVVGRVQPEGIYELVGSFPASGQPPWLDQFAAGRQAYLERRWEAASEAFAAVLLLKPEDRPARLYLERCRQFAEAPPPEDWRGVYVLPTK